MTAALRTWLFWISASGLAVLLGWGLCGLPACGTFDGAYGQLMNRSALPQRHVQNAVAAVAYDYRGFDTLGEELILFAAVIGTALLLRAGRDEAEEVPEDDLPSREVRKTSQAVWTVALIMAVFTVVSGGYIVLHAHLSPGGGFQGGMMLASGVLFVYLAGDYHALRRIAPKEALDPVESLGVAAFLAIGLLGLRGGNGYLTNTLPLGTMGHVLSAGFIPLINILIGVAVGAGVVLLLSDFLEQTLILREQRQRFGVEHEP